MAYTRASQAWRDPHGHSCFPHFKVIGFSYPVVPKGAARKKLSCFLQGTNGITTRSKDATRSKSFWLSCSRLRHPGANECSSPVRALSQVRNRCSNLWSLGLNKSNDALMPLLKLAKPKASFEINSHVFQPCLMLTRCKPLTPAKAALKKETRRRVAREREKEKIVEVKFVDVEHTC